MKVFAALAALLLLSSLLAAESYSSTSVVDGWLEVQRTSVSLPPGSCSPDSVTDACANTGAIQGQASPRESTKVSLKFRNIGTDTHDSVQAEESLSYVPNGVAVSFSPKPFSYDGRKALFALGDFAPGQAKEVSFSFGATLSEGAFERIAPTSITAGTPSASLSAPFKSQVGSTMTIYLRSDRGEPVGNALVTIHFPDGKARDVLTNPQGKVSFVATRAGFYTYSVSGYLLSDIVSTRVEEAAQDEIPKAAAASADGGLLPSLFGALPTVAGVFAFLVVVLLIYNFFRSRREESEYDQPQQAYAQPQKPAQPQVYSQTYSFGANGGGSAAREEKVREATRDILESRKRQMQPPQQAPVEEQEESEAIPDEVAESERAFSAREPGEVDDEIAKLERQAGEGGESASLDEGGSDLESTIRQLEEIRERLRQRREGMEAEAENGEGGAGLEGEEPEDREPVRPLPKKPTVPPQKAKRTAKPQQRVKGK
jgi:hypothetical protein